jgi:integrase
VGAHRGAGGESLPELGPDATAVLEGAGRSGIEAASQALGHSDLNTTLSIYGHQDASDVERAMEKYAEAKAGGTP